MTEGGLDALKCPEPECRREMDPYDLRALLTEDEFERWQELSLQRTLDAMGDGA